jgi:Fur family ferric uptake transcriptional regulator
MGEAAAVHRMTRQRAAVLRALEASDDFLSAQQWHVRLLEEDCPIGLATVYRTLQALAETGEVDSVRNTDGEVLYRRCEGGRHHHHLRCRECGAAVEIEGPGVEAWAEGVAAKHGYSGVEHTIELTGLCPGCSAKRA